MVIFSANFCEKFKHESPFKETPKLEKPNLLTTRIEYQVEAPTPDITDTISINQLLETSNVTHRNIMYHRSDQKSEISRHIPKAKPAHSLQKPTQNFKETVVNTAPYLEYLEYKKQVPGHAKIKSPPGPRLKTYRTPTQNSGKSRREGKGSTGSGSAKSETSTHNPNLRSISINSILGRKNGRILIFTFFTFLDQELLKSPEHQPKEMDIPIGPKENFIKARDLWTFGPFNTPSLLTSLKR